MKKKYFDQLCAVIGVCLMFVLFPGKCQAASHIKLISTKPYKVTLQGDRVHYSSRGLHVLKRNGDAAFFGDMQIEATCNGGGRVNVLTAGGVSSEPQDHHRTERLFLVMADLETTGTDLRAVCSDGSDGTVLHNIKFKATLDCFASGPGHYYIHETISHPIQITCKNVLPPEQTFARVFPATVSYQCPQSVPEEEYNDFPTPYKIVVSGFHIGHVAVDALLHPTPEKQCIRKKDNK